MMNIFPFILFATLVSLMGCDTRYEHVWSEGARQTPLPKVVDNGPQVVQPAAAVVAADFSTPEEEPVADPLPAKPQAVSPPLESSSLGRYLSLDSKLYLTKGGELFGDLTIRNNNFVSVNRIRVHCVEYNVNHSPIREASATWEKTLGAGESGYWDQVNFGYVQNDFDTVHCEIADAELS